MRKWPKARMEQSRGAINTRAITHVEFVPMSSLGRVPDRHGWNGNPDCAASSSTGSPVVYCSTIGNPKKRFTVALIYDLTLTLRAYFFSA